MSFKCSTTSKIKSAEPSKNALKSRKSESSWSNASVLSLEKMNKECIGTRIESVYSQIQPYEKGS
jgi:hypothetical protein